MKRINYRNKLHKKSKTEKNLNLRKDLSNEHEILQRNLKKETQLEKGIIISSSWKIKII